MRYRLKTTVGIQTERMARLKAEAGGFVLLTHVPTAGDVAHSARDLLTVYKDQQGTEQNYGFLKAPVLVNSLFLKKPERLEAVGRICLLARLRWRFMERAMRTSVDTTSTPLTGWDKKATERPTSFMMVTKCAGVIVVQLGDHRQLARPLSGVQQP
jgi:transposase